MIVFKGMVWQAVWVVFCTVMVSACAVDAVVGRERPGRFDHLPQLALLWKAPIPTQGTPFVWDTTVFVLGERNDVYAVDIKTGAVQWHQSLRHDNVATEGRNLYVVGNMLVAGAAWLYGVDARTGVMKWAVEETSDGYYPGYFDFTFSGDTVYTGSPSGWAFAFDARTGRELWATSIAESPASIYDVHYVDGRLFYSFTDFDSAFPAKIPPLGGVASLNAHDGSARWSTVYSWPDRPLYATSISGGVGISRSESLMLVATADFYVRALRLSDGSEVWRVPPFYHDTTRTDSRGIVSCRDRVFVTSLADYVHAYDIRSGQLAWQIQTGRGSPNWRPRCDDDFLYIIDGSGDLRVYDRRDGKLVGFGLAGTEKEPEAFVYPPAIADTVVYVAASDGFYAYRKPKRP